MPATLTILSDITSKAVLAWIPERGVCSLCALQGGSGIPLGLTSCLQCTVSGRALSLLAPAAVAKSTAGWHVEADSV